MSRSQGKGSLKEKLIKLKRVDHKVKGQKDRLIPNKNHRSTKEQACAQLQSHLDAQKPVT